MELDRDKFIQMSKVAYAKHNYAANVVCLPDGTVSHENTLIHCHNRSVAEAIAIMAETILECTKKT